MSRRWKMVATLAGCLVLIVASAFLTLRVQSGSELDAYKKVLRQKGEKLELAELLAPPGAPEENSANAFQDAVGMFSTAMDNYSAMQMVAPGRAKICWKQPEVRGDDFTNSWDQYRDYVEADRPAVALLHQVLERPRLDFQLDYTLGARLPLPHLASMKRAAMKLEAASLLNLHDGDTGAAATNILTMLALVQRDYRDDLIIGHLVRVAITAVAVAPTWELLQTTNVSEAALASMQNGWQQLNFLKDAEKTISLERAWVSDVIQKYRASHEHFKELAGGALAMSASSSGGPSGWESLTDGPRYAVAEIMWRCSWSYSQELELDKRDQIILETLRTMQTNHSQFYAGDYDAMAIRLLSLGGTNISGTLFHSLEIPDFQDDFDWNTSSMIRKTLRIETARRLVVTAIALKRFQLKRGKLPEKLGELAPEFLPSVPIDPFDGKPLKYHPNDHDTFLLYSVGEDGTDDGGDAGSPSSGTAGWYWLRARDWVWPQPATPAEVQFFYEHPPK
ncbi:MAG TPA: hypothetical protein VL970_14630 [Candidatus Acidoferrales bacterium]|nr:hypothetical protein [Candidatus Acidoferrales bacterium]